MNKHYSFLHLEWKKATSMSDEDDDFDSDDFDVDSNAASEGKVFSLGDAVR